VIVRVGRASVKTQLPVLFLGLGLTNAMVPVRGADNTLGKWLSLTG